MRLYLSLLLCLLSLGCAAGRHSRITYLPSEATSPITRIEIAETVFRHMCQPDPVEAESSHKINPVHKVCFLAIGSEREDPSPELLARLTDVNPPVKPISAGNWREFFIYDKTTGERGAAFYIHTILMRSKDEAEVEAVIHPGGGLSASGPVYQVKRRNGKWIVVASRLKWIS